MKYQNVYCKNCIEQWERRDNKYPNRCQSPNYQKSLEKNRILSNLKFKCINCEDEIEYNNVETYHNSCKIKGKNKIKKIPSNTIQKLGIIQEEHHNSSKIQKKKVKENSSK
jgi:hypothetical protein